MIYAQIINGTITNTVVLEDASILALFQNDAMSGLPFDYVLQINNLYPRPGIGWTFDGISFYPPIEPADDIGE